MTAAPTAPAVSGLSYDKQAYNPGDTITVTATGMAGSQISIHNGTGTATFTDAATGLTGSLSGSYTVTSPVEDTTTAGFTDDQGRVFTPTKISQTPAGLVTAVFTATA